MKYDWLLALAGVVLALGSLFIGMRVDMTSFRAGVCVVLLVIAGLALGIENE